jgi:hypothetical protein
VHFCTDQELWPTNARARCVSDVKLISALNKNALILKPNIDQITRPYFNEVEANEAKQTQIIKGTL